MVTSSANVGVSYDTKEHMTEMDRFYARGSFRETTVLWRQELNSLPRVVVPTTLISFAEKY